MQERMLYPIPGISVGYKASEPNPGRNVYREKTKAGRTIRDESLTSAGYVLRTIKQKFAQAFSLRTTHSSE